MAKKTQTAKSIIYPWIIIESNTSTPSRWTQQIQMKKTLKLCTEWVWANKKLVLLRDGVKDCIPFPEGSGWPLPCWPIPDCNTIKVEQVIWLENNSLVYSNPNATDWWLTHTSVDGTITFIKLSHTELLSFTANTPLTITHNLNSTSVSVTAYLDGEEVSVTVNWRTANTIDITSTITDDIEIIVRK